jgi:hypothetical protein
VPDPPLPDPPPPPAANAIRPPAAATPPTITSVFVPRPPADCAVLEPPAALPGAAPVLPIVTPSALKPLIDACTSAVWAAAACSTWPPASRATPMTIVPVGVLVAIIMP